MSKMSKKIMVVDDDPTIREIIAFNLKKRGFQVVLASNGAEAIKILSEQIDLLILDVIMPEIDGWEVLKYIRDHFEKSKIRILLLTAKSSDRDKLIGQTILDADEYLTKPFDMQTLLERVNHLFQEQEY